MHQQIYFLQLLFQTDLSSSINRFLQHQIFTPPSITLIGQINCGKSSLIQTLLCKSFLPKRRCQSTRTPIQIHLKTIDQNSPPFCVFIKPQIAKIFWDFNQVEYQIQKATSLLAGTFNYNTSTVPIIINIYSPLFPNITFIDLPGFNFISSFSTANNYFANLQKYCNNKDALIICTIHANYYNSQCIAHAMKIDPHRVIGVVTKVDLMDRGTDISELVTNNFVIIPRGYVGIKNRSQEDVENFQSFQLSFQREKKFFKNHSIYSKMNKDYFGRESLIKSITAYFKDKFIEQLLLNKEYIEQKRRDAIKIKLQAQQQYNLFLKPLSSTRDCWNISINIFQQFVRSFKYGSNIKIGISKKSIGSSLKQIYSTIFKLEEIKNVYDIEELYTNLKLSPQTQYADFCEKDQAQRYENICLLLLSYLQNKAIQILTNINDLLLQQLTIIAHNHLENYPILSKTIINKLEDFLNNNKNNTERVIILNIRSLLYYKSQFHNLQESYGCNLSKDVVLQLVQSKLSLVSFVKIFISFYQKTVSTLQEIIPKNISFLFIKKIKDQIQIYIYQSLLSNTNTSKLSSIIQLQEKLDKANKLERAFKQLNEIFQEQMNKRKQTKESAEQDFSFDQQSNGQNKSEQKQEVIQ